jgi:hypothetical protein
MSETTDDDPNDEPRLLTRIDGEAARLLVHIEPIEDAEDGPTDAGDPAQAPPPDSSGLTE